MDARFRSKLNHNARFIRLAHWEFWPSSLLYIPVYFYFLWLALKSRSLLFFTAANPAIDTGGMFGESKWSVLQKVPRHLIPKTAYVKPGTPMGQVLEELKLLGIPFPLIAKPDVGERGFLVERIDDAATLEQYLSRFRVNFLLQEFIDYPCEYNILFNKLPGESKGEIVSVTVKKYMSVKGDGRSTVQELMRDDMNSFLQIERLRKDKPHVLEQVPAAGETVSVETIGNHARGTKFFDGRKMVDEEMTRAFNRIAEQISGMHVFRFDVKCKSPEDLRKGVIKVVELNGAGGEPTHIYETGYSLLKAWGDLLRQWGVIYKAGKLNHRDGVPYMSFNEGLTKFKAYLNYKDRLSKM